MHAAGAASQIRAIRFLECAARVRHRRHRCQIPQGRAAASGRIGPAWGTAAGS